MASFAVDPEGVVETQPQSSAPTNTALQEWISEYNLPSGDLVYAALTDAMVTNPGDLLELTNEDIRDICIESKLPIMIKRKLLNAKQLYHTRVAASVSKICTKNSDDSKETIVILSVSDKETKLQKKIENLSEDNISNLLNDIKNKIEINEDLRIKNVKLINDTFDDLMKQLSVKKTDFIKDVSQFHENKKESFENICENLININIECDRTLEDYKTMVIKSSSNGSNMNADERISYLEKNYNNCNDEYNEAYDEYQNEQQNEIVCLQNDDIVDNICNDELSNLFNIEYNDYIDSDYNDYLDTVEVDIDNCDDDNDDDDDEKSIEWNNQIHVPHGAILTVSTVRASKRKLRAHGVLVITGRGEGMLNFLICTE